jgi:hypothetical protein
MRPPKFSGEVRQKLVELWREQGESLLISDRCRAFLNDYFPTERHDTFVLSSVAREGLVQTTRPTSSPSTAIALFAAKIQKSCGFDHDTAVWAAESWMLARDWIRPMDVSTHFQCPSCSCNGVADATWKGRIAVCPGCKAQLEFDAGLVIKREVKGRVNRKWSTSTAWVLVDATSTQGSMPVQQVRSAIVKLLEDPTLGAYRKAESLDLFRIVAVLEPEVRMALADVAASGSNQTSLNSLLTRILESYTGRIPGLMVARGSGKDFMERLKRIAPDYDDGDPLGVIEFPPFKGIESGIVLTNTALHHVPSGVPARVKTALPSLAECRPVPDRLHEIAVGAQGPKISMRNSGISRSVAIPLFRSLGSIAGAFETNEN